MIISSNKNHTKKQTLI